MQKAENEAQMKRTAALREIQQQIIEKQNKIKLLEAQIGLHCSVFFRFTVLICLLLACFFFLPFLLLFCLFFFFLLFRSFLPSAFLFVSFWHLFLVLLPVSN